MPRTTARTAFGTQLFRGDGATPTEAFTQIGEITEIQPPEVRRETVDATHMESDDQYMERIPAMLDSGQVTFTLNWDPASNTYANLRSDCENGTLRSWRIVIGGASGRRIEGKGYVTQLTPQTPRSDVRRLQCTIDTQGKWSIVNNP